MQQTDKDAFFAALEMCFANYREPAPLSGVVDDWMNHLQPYTIMQVGNSIEHHKRSSRFVPTLADILALLPKDPSEWPVAATAFGEMLLIESGRFALTTNEHIAAFEVARPLLDARDRFNASRAFEDRYANLVTAAKNAGKRAVWFLTNAGSDPEGMYRREALRDGVRCGRLAKDRGIELAALLPPEPDKVPEHGPDGRLPALPAPEPSDSALSEIDKLRAIMKPDYGKNPLRDKSPEMSIADVQKAEAKRRFEEYQALQDRKRELDEREAAIAAREAALGRVAA